MRMKTSVTALGLFSSMALYGCGGDGGSSSPSPTPNTSYSVKAIDGYLRGATVWLDLNANFQLDSGEPSATSQAGGVATLDVSGITNPENYPVVVQAKAGETIDEDTGNTISNDFTLSAPAGVVQVTPLSTLVHIEVSSGGSADVDSAQAKIASQLGISSDDVLSDYKANGSNSAAFAARNLVSSRSMPSSPSALNTAANDKDGTNELLEQAATVSVVIKTQVESKTEAELEDVFINSKGDVDSDSDKDGVADIDDAFPDNAAEWLDTDKDGTGNNADTDDDGDNVLDVDDAFPLDKNETLDTDKDGTGNNADDDDDGDGVNDEEDAFPLDKNETVDTDGDKVGNNADTDDDNDGVADDQDAFPLDKDETLDSDGDKIGNNADSDDDNDGVPDDLDEDPLDDSVGASDLGKIIQFMQQQSAVYSLSSDEDNGVTHVYSETLTVNGDKAERTSQVLIKANKTEVLKTSDDSDIVMTSSGWAVQNGNYTVDFSNNSLMAYPSDHTEVKYTLSGALKDLTGTLIVDTDIDWDNYASATATYPTNSSLAKLTLTPMQDIYYLWDWTPYVHDNLNNNSHHGASSLNELIFANAGGSTVNTGELQGMDLVKDGIVKFVEGGTAQYYTIDWNGNTATLVATSTWAQNTVNGEALLTFTVPQAALNAFGDAFDEPTPNMVVSVYQNSVRIGNHEVANVQLEEEHVLLFSAAAKEALVANVNIPLNQCGKGDTDGTTTVGMTEFQAAIESCYGSSNLTEAMLSGNNFHRVRGDGSTRDYTFNADHSLTVYKDGVESYSANWTVESGLVKVTYPNSPNDSWYWALLDSNSTTWSLKFLDIYTENEALVTEIWSDTVSMVAVGSCVVEEGLNKTYSDFTAAISAFESCNGDLPSVSSSDVSGAKLYRSKSNGETRSFSFSSDSMMQYYRDGMVRSRKWSINDDGFIEILLPDDTPDQYLALLKEPNGDDVLQFAVFGSADAEIWLTQYNSVEEKPAIAECTTGNTEWDDANDRPLTTATYAEFTQAVATCLQQSESGAYFSSTFMEQLPRVMSSSVEGETESYTFNSGGTGSYTDGDGNYAFTWAVNDTTHELTVTLNANGQTYLDNMYIVDTDGVAFSLKVLSRSTEWEGVGDDNGGDLWSGVYTFSQP